MIDKVGGIVIKDKKVLVVRKKQKRIFWSLLFLEEKENPEKLIWKHYSVKCKKRSILKLSKRST